MMPRELRMAKKRKTLLPPRKSAHARERGLWQTGQTESKVASQGGQGPAFGSLERVGWYFCLPPWRAGVPLSFGYSAVPVYCAEFLFYKRPRGKGRVNFDSFLGESALLVLTWVRLVLVCPPRFSEGLAVKGQSSCGPRMYSQGGEGECIRNEKLTSLFFVVVCLFVLLCI